MKKLFTVLLSILMVCSVAFGLTACATKEYTVTFVFDNGQDNVTSTVKEGGKVVKPTDPTKTGFEFDGWYVTVDGEEKLYDFESEVTSNLTLTAKYNEVDVDLRRVISFTSHEYAKYIFDDGVTPRRADDGETIKFKVKPSVFCAEGAENNMYVSVNDKEISPDRNGYYSFTVNGNTTIRVDGISIDRSPIPYEDGFYTIKRPSHLNLLIENVNNLDSRYLSAYYFLDADLDLEGEEIKPIGAVIDRNNNGGFSGIFYGGGHTVKNFTMGAEYPTVGLFGYNRGIVYDLHIKDVHYDIDCEDTNYFIGGIAGMNMGEILLCSFDGEFTISTSSASSSVFLGGISGGIQSVSEDYAASIEYCEVKADITSIGSESLFAAGGIVGASMGSAESASAYITNCTYSGDITENIMFAGGIAGRLGTYSAIANCYTAGEIDIDNTGTGVGSDSSSLKQYGSAGGLIGLAEPESAVSFSFSKMTVSATGEILDGTEAGDGLLVGSAYKADAIQLDENKCVLYNSFAFEKLTEEQKEYNYNSVDGWNALLGWTNLDWTVSADGTPKINFNGEGLGDNDNKEFTITFNFEKEVRFTEDGENKTGKTLIQKSGGYVPIGSSGMNAAISTETDGKWISYGYFLDEEHTQRIPAAMVLTQNIDVYVGFANYNDIPTEPFYANFDGHDVKLEFMSDISSLDEVIVIMTEGGTVSGYRYSYDGKRIIIRDAYFPYFGEIFADGYAQVANFIVEFVDADRTQLKIYDKIYFTDNREEEIPEEYQVRYGAVKAFMRNDLMGRWYDGSDKEYFFRADGTGYILDEKGNDAGEFTYTYNKTTNDVTFTQGNETANGKYNVGSITFNDKALSVSKYDDFRGTWESSFASGLKDITFNGLGLGSDGKVTYNGKEYSYSVNDSSYDQTLTFVADGKQITATFDADGLMNLTVNGVTDVYGMSGSYMGTWLDPLEDYVLMLGGINKDGYGMAQDSDGYFYTYIAEDQKDEEGNVIAQAMTLFYGVNPYVPFIFNPEAKVTMGEGTLNIMGEDFWGPIIQQTLYSVDAVEGMWLSLGNLSFEFNGLGLYYYKPYKTDGDGNYIDEEGHITDKPIIDENAKETLLGDVYVTDETDPDAEREVVPYKYFRDKQRAEFDYDGKTYYANFASGKITIVEKDSEKPGLVYAAADDMYGMKFVGKLTEDDEKVTLSFNGKSNTPGAAKATLKKNDGSTVEFDYEIGATGEVTLTDGDTTLTARANAETEMYEIKDGDDELFASLGYFNALAGHTYHGLSGAQLIINDNFTLTGATGRFVYTDPEKEPDEITIQYYDKYNVILYFKGQPYGVLTAWNDSGMGAVFTLSGDRIPLYEAAGLKGEYTAAGNKTLVMQGNGYSPYFGDVTMTVAGEKKSMYYEIDLKGNVTIFDLVPVTDANGNLDYNRVDMFNVYDSEPSDADAVAYTDSAQNKTLWLVAVEAE